ncbi:MAG: hypothetical protein GXX86_13410 [Propionibacterium sp.]|nr:hypothetical protein [Propionibacterium sp.]
MRTAEELALLAGETLSLWLRALPRLVFWWGVGFAVHELAVLAAAALGAEHRIVATIIFVLGMVAQLVALIMMIHSVRPYLITGGTGPVAPATSPRADPQRSTHTVLATTLGPFLAVYAVWGLTQAEVTRLVSTNLTLHGAAVTEWSVHLTDWRFYLVLAAAAWVLRRALGWFDRRRPPRGWPGLLGHLLDGMSVLATFIAAVQLGRDLTAWLSTRRVAQWWLDTWQAALTALGDWFGPRVPAVVQAAVDWVWATGVPALTHQVALPLMWLALTATVFGWRIGARSLTRGTRWEATVDRAAARTGGTGWAPVRWAVEGAGADLRDKWLPVLHSLRLIAAAGPRFVGSYLVLGAALTGLALGWDWLLLVLGGPLPAESAQAYAPVRRLLAGLVFAPLQVALWAAAFDRGVADTTGAGWREARLRRAARVGD